VALANEGKELAAMLKFIASLNIVCVLNLHDACIRDRKRCGPAMGVTLAI